MNKSELITAMVEKSELPRKDVEKVLGAFTETVTNALKNEEKIQLIGFGTFDVTKRAAREGRNPATGDTIQIPASVTPKFTAGKALKDAVNQ